MKCLGEAGETDKLVCARLLNYLLSECRRLGQKPSHHSQASLQLNDTGGMNTAFREAQGKL